MLEQECKKTEIYAYGFPISNKVTKGALTINYLPWIDEENFEQQLKYADIFLSLSKYETFGIALTKAYLYGCKIVAFEKAGALEQISKYPQVFTFDKHNCNSLYESYSSALKLDPKAILVENVLSPNAMTDSYRRIILEK